MLHVASYLMLVKSNMINSIWTNLYNHILSSPICNDENYANQFEWHNL